MASEEPDSIIAWSPTTNNVYRLHEWHDAGENKHIAERKTLLLEDWTPTECTRTDCETWAVGTVRFVGEETADLCPTHLDAAHDRDDVLDAGPLPLGAYEDLQDLIGFDPDDSPVVTDGGRRRAPHQPDADLPDLPERGAGAARLALLVAQSDLLEARHLAPDADTREEIDSLLAQVQRVSDDLADRLDEAVDRGEGIEPDGGVAESTPDLDVLRWELAESVGFCYEADPTCAECDAEDVHIDPGRDLDAFAYRCEAHHRLGFTWWWQVGEHAAPLAADQLFRCDECDAPFVIPFGIHYCWRDRQPDSARQFVTEERCLDCVDPQRVRGHLRRYNSTLAVDGGEQ